MSHLQVAVLRGGPSEEYQVSMKTGATVLQALAENGYQTKDIVITRQGQWLDRGLVKDPENALLAIDVVFIALHGTYGEDGEVQKIIQRQGIPFTGSRSFASAVAFNKQLTKDSLKDHGVLMAQHREISRDLESEVVTITNEIKEKFGKEYIIKPTSSGSSFGVEFVGEDESLENAIRKSLDKYEKIMVEEFIRGREATSATLEKFRDQEVYVFPTIEIITPKDAQFFSTDSKYDGRTLEICPSNFSYSDREKIAEISALVHKALDLSQYSRSDFIVNDNGIYFLEVNTLPGLTNESLYPKAAASVGLDINQLIAHLVENATC
jgi:D-alanine-D-alanine ligase